MYGMHGNVDINTFIFLPATNFFEKVVSSFFRMVFWN